MLNFSQSLRSGENTNKITSKDSRDAEEKLIRYLAELHHKGEINILTFRYYSRLLNLHKVAILNKKNKIDLRNIDISITKQ